MTTEAEENRRDEILARVGELHAMADGLNRADTDSEFDAALARIEDQVQRLREL